MARAFTFGMVCADVVAREGRTRCDGQWLANGIAARNERVRSGLIEGSTAFKERACARSCRNGIAHTRQVVRKPAAEECREPVARVERPHSFTCRSICKPVGRVERSPLSRLVRAHYAAMCQQPIVILQKIADCHLSNGARSYLT